MLHLILATSAEAEPLIHRFRLERIEGAFPIYRSETTALIVSGIGRVAAAAATAYLYARTDEEPFAVFLNVGVAGHATRSPGEAVLAHTVTDDATGERWYPTRLPGPHVDPVEVRTVARPETEYPSDAAYDMEASGFYPAALRFSTAELVQCLKIVSDNREHPASRLRPEAIRELVEKRTEVVAETAGHLETLASELDAARRDRERDALVDGYRRRWRFTTSESRALVRLITRWNALDERAEKSPEEFGDAQRAADVLELMSARLHRIFREQPL